jgi:hypothetical protein
LFSTEIEFFFGFVDRDIGQHEDFMGGKDPEVLAHMIKNCSSYHEPDVETVKRNP